MSSWILCSFSFLTSTCLALYFVHMLRTNRKIICDCLGLRTNHAVITGANSGIGKATAIELSKRNWELTLACRDLQSANRVQAEIFQLTGNKNVNVSHLDLEDLHSIETFVKSLSNRPVHVLINNAGIFPRMHRSIPNMNDGIDSTLMTNYVGPFYLTNLLLPLLEMSSKQSSSFARIIFVSSSLSSKATFESPKTLFDYSKNPNGWNAQVSYANSKLACNLFARQLSRSWCASGDRKYLNVYTLFTGGMVNTNLSRDFIAGYSFPMRWLLQTLSGLLLRSSHDACQSVIHCALSDNVRYAHQSKQDAVNRDDDDNDLLINNSVPINWPENSQNLKLAECLVEYTSSLFPSLSDPQNSEVS